MLEKFREILDVDLRNKKAYSVYVACSGGIDSMVLVDLLLKSGLKPTLLHCNFKLRGNNADEDEQFIISYGNKFDLKVITSSFETETYANDKKLSIQEAARNLRYSWFDKIASKSANPIVLTAHHLNDSIETFFINLLRGTGVKGLSGISRFNEIYYRPLLNFTKREIETYQNENNIKFRQDQSNFKSIYTRNKFRNEVIPILNEMTSDFDKKMSSLFSELNQLNEFIEKKSIQLYNNLVIEENEVFKFKIEKLKGLSEYELKLLLQNFNVNRKKILEFKKFLDSNTGSEFLTNDYRFLTDRNLILVKQITPINSNFSQTIDKSPCHLTTELGIISFQTSDQTEIIVNNQILQLDLNKVEFPLTLRKWKYGDRFTPLGMAGTKLISDFLIDKKISKLQKEKTYVVIDSTETIIAIVGIAINEKFKITDQTNSVLEISTS